MSAFNSTCMADCSKAHLWLLLICQKRRAKTVNGAIYAEAEVLILKIFFYESDVNVTLSTADGVTQITKL